MCITYHSQCPHGDAPAWRRSVPAHTPGQTKALTDLATAGCALLRACLPEEVVPVPTFSHVLRFPLPEAALANGSREQEDDVEHSEEEDAVEGEDQSDVDGVGGEGALDEGLTHEEELALCTGDSGLQLHEKVVSGASVAQGAESISHGTVKPTLTEASPGELHACQEPGRDGCRTGRVTAWQGGDGLLFAKSQSFSPPVSQHLLTTGDSEGTETGLQYGVIPEKVGESGAIPEEEGEGHSGFMLPLQPPSSENSDACLTPKTSPNLSACSSSSALPGKDTDLYQFDQFDHFFPELSNGSSHSDAVVLDSLSGHCSQEEQREEEEEVLTVESISTSELLTAAEGSQVSVCNAEETRSKEEGQFLPEGVYCVRVCVCVCVCACECMCVCLFMSVCVCAYRCACMCMYIYMYVCILYCVYTPYMLVFTVRTYVYD